MRISIIGTFASALAIAATIGLAPSAQAEANPPGCPKGYFCVYSGPNQTGTLLRKWSGNWVAKDTSQFVRGVRSAFSNGNPCIGCDHVESLTYLPDNNWTFYYHYNPGPGTYKMTFPVAGIVKSVKWVGER